MFKILKRKPWFYTWNFLRNNSHFIKGNVIDIGCGSAKYKPIILRLDGVKSYKGLDFFRAGIADIVADLNKRLPIENDKYDTAICISVVEHLLEPQLALDEIYRILKPSGHLLLATPWVYPFHGEPHDYFRYSRFALKYMLEKSGFELVSVQPTGGKIRVLLAIIRQWIPILGRVVSLAEKLVPRILPLKNISDEKLLDTPSNQIVALKK